MQVLPPVEIDSITINVASAALIRVGLGGNVSVPVRDLPGGIVELIVGETAQFTALMWSGDEVVGCSEGGHCDGYPSAAILGNEFPQYQQAGYTDHGKARFQKYVMASAG